MGLRSALLFGYSIVAVIVIKSVVSLESCSRCIVEQLDAMGKAGWAGTAVSGSENTGTGHSITLPVWLEFRLRVLL